MTMLQDSAARERAATAVDRNLVVTAGAGTGKTTLLVDRLVHLLLRQPEPLAIGEIVALTFTNKAATEMKLRLRDRLNALLDLDVGAPPVMAGRRREWDQLLDLRARYALSKGRIDELAAKALRELEKSQIGTIHSFAAHLLRLYPVESNVDPAFQEDEGDRFKQYFNREWLIWLDSELGPAGTHHDVWRAALRVVTLEDLQELAGRLVGELIPLDKPMIQIEGQSKSGNLPLPIRDWMSGLAEKANALGTAHPKTHTLERMLEASAACLQRAAVMGPQAPDVRASLEQLDRDVPGMTTSWSKNEYAQAKHIIKVAQALARIEVGPLVSVLGLLIPFADGCRRRFVQSGFVSFDGLLARARDLLRDYPMIRRELKGQFRAILVDEFQDTDPVQYEMILYLAESAGREDKDWRAVRLEAGKLFIVGDPKQSIYAFRRADMEAYDAVVEDRVLAQNPRGERQTLHTNFRSHSRLLGPINAFFARVFPLEPIKGVQPQNEPLLAVEAETRPLSGERIEIRLVRPEEPDADADAASRAEAEELARWLREEVLDRQEIREHDVPVKIKPKHVAILFRTLTKARDYLDALRRYDIPCLTEGEKHFYERQEVIDAINLLRAAASPHDRVALVGVLRSSLGGMSDVEIEALARQNLPDFRKTPDGRVVSGEHRSAESARPVYVLLQELNREIPRLPLTEVMDAMLAKSPLMELAAASVDREQAVANLMKLRDLVAELAQRSDLTLHRLIAELTNRVSNPPDEAESPLAEEGPEEREQHGAVRLLSIHKAKGLEFPVVILAGLHRGTDRRESRILVQHDWSTGVVGVRMGNLQTLGGIYVGAKLAERQRAEQSRVLYVAMTRAKRRLILSAGIPKSRIGESFLSLAGQGLGLDLHAVERSTTVRLGDDEVPIEVVQGREAPPQLSRQDAVWQESHDDLAALRARWSERSRRWQEGRQHVLIASPTAVKARESRPAKVRIGEKVRRSDKELQRDMALLVGTLAHRVMEQWDFTDDPMKLDEHVGAICRTGIPPEWMRTVDPAEISNEVREVFKVFAASEPYQKLRRATILGREVPFTIPWSESSVQHAACSVQRCVMEGVIDLLYRLDGQVWIADYKTDRVSDDEIAGRVAEYDLQARVYTEAVRRCLGIENVNFQFVFLRNGQAVQV